MERKKMTTEEKFIQACKKAEIARLSGWEEPKGFARPPLRDLTKNENLALDALVQYDCHLCYWLMVETSKITIDNQFEKYLYRKEEYDRFSSKHLHNKITSADIWYAKYKIYEFGLSAKNFSMLNHSARHHRVSVPRGDYYAPEPTADMRYSYLVLDFVPATVKDGNNIIYIWECKNTPDIDYEKLWNEQRRM